MSPVRPKTAAAKAVAAGRMAHAEIVPDARNVGSAESADLVRSAVVGAIVRTAKGVEVRAAVEVDVVA